MHTGQLFLSHRPTVFVFSRSARENSQHKRNCSLTDHKVVSVNTQHAELCGFRNWWTLTKCILFGGPPSHHDTVQVITWNHGGIQMVQSFTLTRNPPATAESMWRTLTAGKSRHWFKRQEETGPSGCFLLISAKIFPKTMLLGIVKGDQWLFWETKYS